MNHTEGMKATGGRSVARDCQRHNGFVFVYGVCDRVANAMKTARPCRMKELQL